MLNNGYLHLITWLIEHTEIYGTDLKKVRSGAKPVIYNVSYSANKVRTVSILGADLIE